ncbi:MAG TPA: hypothetical protein VI703_11615 [Anaerolineales bacterium]|nr:hypothetical protein [Anaerolineales bacterium]
MFSDTISLLALLIVHFGFAGLLGRAASRVQTLVEGAFLVFFSILYLTATFALPMPVWVNGLVLLASFIVATLSASRASRNQLRPGLSWSYASFAMLLILLWSAVQGWQAPLLALGASAGLAALLALRRGLAIAS